jgi:hypothetical protein
MKRLIRAAFSRPIVIASLRVAAVVGTALNLINQGPAIWSGEGASWVHLALNYLVPFCVASYSGAAVSVRQGGNP